VTALLTAWTWLRSPVGKLIGMAALIGLCWFVALTWLKARDARNDAAGYARADTDWRARWAEAERASLAEIETVRADLAAQRRATAAANADAQRARDEAREAAERETEIIIREVEAASPAQCVVTEAEAAALNRLR
jgi:hypothetical protein